METSRGGATASSTGIGLGGALTVLFVGLKLTGYIDWSWWWVLAPAWGSVLLVIALIVALLGIALAMAVRDEKRTKARRRA